MVKFTTFGLFSFNHLALTTNFVVPYSNLSVKKSSKTLDVCCPPPPHTHTHIHTPFQVFLDLCATGKNSTSDAAGKQCL